MMALLFILLQAHASARFNVTTQVVVGCRIDTEAASVQCARGLVVEPRTVVRDGVLWVLF